VPPLLVISGQWSVVSEASPQIDEAFVVKSEFQISKSETNPNDQNSNVQNQKAFGAVVSNLEHLDFGMV
jgi:hypothetical protein